MGLLIDLFGYASIILHGLTIAAQSVAFGSALFVVLLAHPLAPSVANGPLILQQSRRIATVSAVALVFFEAAGLGLQVTVLASTLSLPLFELAGANFAVAGLMKISIASSLAIALCSRESRARPAILLGLVLAGLAVATLTTHANARLDHRAPLLVIEGLHQFGAAIWIGGLPCFLLALARVKEANAFRRIGARYSRMSMAGVTCILVSGIAMMVFFVGDASGFYGTAYGVMVGAKITIFLFLLALGGMNFLLIERLRNAPNISVIRLKRFAEVEFGLGLTIFFAAASLTSVPPAVDLTQDRVTLQEIAERNAPKWPVLTSPDHATLALAELQSRVDANATTEADPPPAYVPGSGQLPPRNAADIAWSEYNHHWAGLFVLAAGLGAMLSRAGLRAGRHWPLLFLGLAAFISIRSDPEVWPLGNEGLLESLRDVEVLQHRLFVLLITALAIFEWRVQARDARQSRAALGFPLLCAVGGALLLTHTHAIANIKDQLLIELTHTPLALASVLAGWSRWLELRLDPRDDNGWGNRIAGWIWPFCLVFIGWLLLSYREA
ncbi:MAG: CopD family protein [Acetobacteraceae bacterium]|nr:CopD family protein [Acetobacteraceae bacterium]